MIIVFDASAAVKWFRAEESGSDVAVDMLMTPDADVWMTDHGVHETLNVVRRRAGTESVGVAWDHMMGTGLRVGTIGRDLISAGAETADALGCDYYDALAPALAHLLGATLVSADRKAHGAVAGVTLIG